MSEIGRVSQRVIELRAKEQERNRLAEEKRLLEEEKEHEKLLLRLAEYSASVSSFFNSLGRTDSGEMLEDFDIPLEWTKSDWLDECPSYRNLKQNLYRPPLQRPLYNAGDDAPICSCTAVDNCGSTCHNRNLFMECDPSSCPSVHAPTVCQPVLSSRLSTARQTTLVSLTTPEEHETPHHEDGEGEAAVSATSSLQFCRNTAIQTKTYPPTAVFRSAQCGHALKVLQDVPANTILIEYLGEVITSRECSERMSEYEEQDDFYFAALGNGLMLDAKHMGSPARFANHSCDPNCTLQKWTVLGEPRIVLVSLRDLLAGAELTYNYQYFDDGFADMKRQTCRCGARQCCGTIGGKVLVPVEDVLVTKVQAALSSGRRQSVEQYESLLHQLQTSAAAHYPQTTLLIEKIQTILSDCDDWLTRYSALMGLSATSNHQALVEMSSVESLLSTAPSAARIEECVALDALLKKAIRAEKTIAQLRDIVCGDNSVGRKSSRPTEKSHELTAVKIEPVNSTTDTMDTADTTDTTDNSVTASSDTAVQKVAAPSTANTVSDVSAVKEDSTTARGRLIWEDVVAAFRLVSAALPLRCPSTSLLVGYVNQYSAWCRRHVLPVAPAADLVDSSVQPLTTSRGVIQHVAQIYTESTHSADFTRFSQDLFLAADFCESRLEIYMENRNRIVTQSPASETAETAGPPADKESSHTLKLEPPIVQPHCTALLKILLARAERRPDDEQVAAAIRAVKAFSGCECPSISSPSSKRKESDTAPLYCFCRLPEAQGESRVMSQCGGCGDWFHPQCVNAALVSLTAVSRSSAKDEMFTCPVCLHLSNSISNFAFAPGTEWRRIAAQPSEVFLAKRNIKAEPKGRPATTQQKKKNVHPSTGSNKRPRSAAECGEHPESDLLPAKRGGGDRLAKSFATVPTAPKAKRSAVRPKDYMSSADLAACLVEEKTLPITGTPVALLLVLCEKFSAQWQERVRRHMLSQGVLEVVERIKNRHLLTNIAGEEAAFSPVSLSLEELLVEAAVLQESLRVYFELRVLRVCPVVQTGLLRELVWSITASVLQREVTLHSVANDHHSTTAAAPAVVVWRSSAPSLGVWQEVIRGGEAVATANGVVNNSQFLQSLKCVLAAAVQWMADADRCSSLHEALLLADRLALLSGVVNLSKSFVCAKLRCVIRPTSLFVRSKSTTTEAVDVADVERGDSLSAADAISSTVDPSSHELVGDSEGDLAEPVYCLCREGDDGRTMICCDRCDEWFHSSCVGVSEDRRRQSSSSAAHGKKAKKGVAASSIDQYTCISCCVQSGAMYPHTW